MWIMSKYGYFSIAKCQQLDDCYVLRSPSVEDLERLHVEARLEGEVEAPGDLGYACQTLLTTGEMYQVIHRLCETIDDQHFLNAISALPSQQSKLRAYCRVKKIMMQWQEEETLLQRESRAKLATAGTAAGIHPQSQAVPQPIHTWHDRADVSPLQNERLIAGAEGGDIRVAEGGGAYYAITSDCSMMAIDESDHVYTNIMEFVSREDRKRYLLHVHSYRMVIEQWRLDYGEPEW